MTQFLVSGGDTVRIRRKTLPTIMTGMSLDVVPLRRIQNRILGDISIPNHLVVSAVQPVSL